MAIKVLLADDHRAVRCALGVVLGEVPEMTIVGEAADGFAALQLAEQLNPDVIVADTMMTGPNGVEIARLLSEKTSPTRVVILTSQEENCLVVKARDAGAKGLVRKWNPAADLLDAIRIVAAGGTYWPDQGRFSPSQPA